MPERIRLSIYSIQTLNSMWVKFVKGVSGEWKGRSFHYPPGGEYDIEPGLATSEIHAGHAVPLDGFVRRIVEKIAEPKFKVPQIEEEDVKKAVIKRRKRV